MKNEKVVAAAQPLTRAAVSRLSIPRDPAIPISGPEIVDHLIADGWPLNLTRKSAAALHTLLWGPCSSRTLERLPIARRIVGGRAVIPIHDFVKWAQERFDAAPMIGGPGEGGSR